MIVIGLTGPSGAGKTTALCVLESYGAVVIDCDAVYHHLVQTDERMLHEIDRNFPGVVVGGVLDRKALGAIVFSNAGALARLSDITHGYVKREVIRRIDAHRSAGQAIVAIEAIALIESGIGTLCDEIIGVLAPEDMRLKRIMAREGVSHDYAAARISSQQPDAFFRAHCDYILEGACPDTAGFVAACKTLFDRVIKGEG